METKTKINKWDLLLKLKSFYTAKNTIKKMKRQPTDWEKILACNITYKGLVFKIYKHFMRFNNIKTNNPVKKWTLLQRRHTDGQEAHENIFNFAK